MKMKLSSILLTTALSYQVDKTVGQDGSCNAGNPCPDSTHCCSEFGYCGIGDAYCGTGCQDNCDGGGGGVTNYNYCGTSWGDAGKCGVTCYDGTNADCLATGETCWADINSCDPVSAPGPSPPATTTTIATGPTTTGATTTTTPYTGALAGGDSRLIAYLGNWQSCPTAAQLDGYTHIVIAFAVSYVYNAGGNICDTTCSISAPPTCGNQVRTDLIANWRAAGKKVILSFGGAGMGGSWLAYPNGCWEPCFGREAEVATQLTSIVQSQGLDGVDIDYEYYHNQQVQQDFLRGITSQLRTKLDALGPDMELTHAPMDSDMVPGGTYYEVLKEKSAELNFLMPQFYNGYTRPAIDGFDGTGSGSQMASTIYGNLVNDMFAGAADKVVFGFCISDCSGTGSNAIGSQAATVMQDIKAYNQGVYSCNGGAFFWVAENDTGGSWSDPVWAEVSKTVGCSNGATTAATTTIATTTTTTTTADPLPGTCSDGTPDGKCSTSDLTQCACSSGGRRLLKGTSVGTEKGLRGNNKIRKLAKKTTETTTTQAATTTTAGTTTTTTAGTTTPTTTTTTSCSCILDPVTTTAATTAATTITTNSSCNCLDQGSYSTMNLCKNACDGNTCKWSGSSRTCAFK